MVSEGSIARSMFERMAYSTNVVIKTYLKLDSMLTYPRIDGGKVIQRKRLIIISMKEHLLQGQMAGRKSYLLLTLKADKFASGHGQKGVIKVCKEIDMPWGTDENGEVIKFDMVMSLSSLSNRITAGGGIRFGEMETHATEVSGLLKSTKVIIEV